MNVFLRAKSDAGRRIARFLDRRGWTVSALTGLGICLGLLTLFLSALSYPKLPAAPLFRSYFGNPLLLLLNLLPPVLLIWLFYFLFGRGWAAYLGAALPSVGLALVSYFKISLRSDPLLAVDLRLVSEATGIVGRYTLEFTPAVQITCLCLLLGLLAAALLIPRAGLRGRSRLLGSLLCLALAVLSLPALYCNRAVYSRTANEGLINRWSDVEVFVSRGFLCPFLHSVGDLIPSPPPGYDTASADALLESFPDADIPEDRKVHVLGVMLEAFCDLTDFPQLAQEPAVARVYEPWHRLEEDSVSGDLLTNIFAGGTVESEWAFLTGSTEHGDYRRETDSYVWYLRDQGYQTFGSHPGYGWFYNRLNVNRYLGFEEYWFTEDHYGALVDPVSAIYHSDHILASELLAQLSERAGDGPCFSFSVSYQNHGPYADTPPEDGTEYVTAASGIPEASRNIWNHYLRGVDETVSAMTELRDGLEKSSEPVVLVLFGDHKPWAGNGNTAYLDAGVSFDLSSEEGFRRYYSTPYVIWANPAARKVLDGPFTGDGGDFSPCFLMPRVFDLCGWEGPGFMQLARKVREITPLVHVRGLYLRENGLTDSLPPEETRFLQEFLCAQYRRETSPRRGPS